MNYYEHHIGDFDQATAHLSAVEDGIYSRMIRWYMASEAPLPADVAVIQRRVRAHSRDEKSAVKTVLAEFFEAREDGHHQKRCDEEIARFKDKQRKAKASADARWGKCERNANASAEHLPYDDADDMRTHPPSIANGMHRAPVPSPQTPSTIPSDATHPQGDTPRRSSSPPTVGVETLVAEGVEPQHARDWLAARKAKRLPLTATAWEKTKREAAKAGITPAQAVGKCAEQGWAGFGAGWGEEAPEQRRGLI